MKPLPTAPGLPSETIQLIIQSLEEAHELRDREVQKQSLAACSLTCRHWAKVIRPLLFRHLEIRSPLDIARLFGFFESPLTTIGPPLQSFIESFTYGIYEAQIPPWTRLHDLSRVIPQAEMKLVINGNSSGPADPSAPQEGLEPSGLDCRTLLHILPRSLPPSLFPFESVRLNNAHSTSATEFISLGQHAGRLKMFICCNVTVRNEPIRRGIRIRGPKSGTLDGSVDLMAVKTVSGDPIHQINLAFTILRPRVRTQLDENEANNALDIVVSLFTLGQNKLDFFNLRVYDEDYWDNGEYDIQGRPSRSILFHAMRLDEPSVDDALRSIGVIFWWTSSQTGPNISVRIEGEDPLPRSHWNDFETRFLEVVTDGSLIADFNAKGFETLNAILAGDILSRVCQQGRLKVCHKGKMVTIEEIISIPAEHQVGGATITLALRERLELLVSHDAQHKKKYLQDLLAEREKAPVPRISGQAEENKGVEDVETSGSDDMRAGSPLCADSSHVIRQHVAGVEDTGMAARTVEGAVKRLQDTNTTQSEQQIVQVVSTRNSQRNSVWMRVKLNLRQLWAKLIAWCATKLGLTGDEDHTPARVDG